MFGRKAATTSATVGEALSILGEKNIITSSQAAEVWGQARRENRDNGPVNYSKTTLEECARQNGSFSGRQKEADWYLIYVADLSISDLWRIRATEPGMRPNLGDQELLAEFEPDPWLEEKAPLGYRLIDMLGRCESDDWHEQERYICKLGGDYERAHDVILLQTLILLAEIHHKERYLSVMHWGMLQSESADHIAIMPEVDHRIHFELTAAELEFGKLPVLISRRPDII